MTPAIALSGTMDMKAVAARARRLLLPSLPDLVFIAILVWLLAGQGASGLLGDGDTGWHIRNGERILRNHAVPFSDPFAFGSAGYAWFAWEWLSDVVFALLHSWGGLKALVLLAGAVIAAAQCIVYRRCSARGVNPLLALCLVFLATNASSVHYLARPHLFTLLAIAAGAWILDEDSGRGMWALVPIAALWVNLHGGFLALFPLIGAKLAERILNRAPRPLIVRTAAVGLVCFGVTFVNPYGWRLYGHLSTYLRSDWIRQSVEEFQSPKFGSESMYCFEILLLLGFAVLPRLISRRRFADALIVAFWAHQALVSVRHVPVYCVLAVPPIAVELNRVWSQWANRVSRRSVFAILHAAGEDWGKLQQTLSPAPWLAVVALAAIPGFSVWPSDFPASRFPSAVVSRNWARLSGHPGDPPLRVFSTDQWSDYLIYRLYPRVQTYFDGRSDFFMGWRGDQYRALMEGRPRSAAILEREGVGIALVPAGWALAGALTNDPAWKVLDRDSAAVLFERRRAAKVPTAFDRSISRCPPIQYRSHG